MAILVFELILTIFLNRSNFVSYVSWINGKKSWILPKNSPKTLILGLENLKKTEIWALNRPKGPLKTKKGKLGHVQMVAGVSRDILTKFQENRSSRFQSHRVLLYFWSFLAIYIGSPLWKNKIQLFFEILCFALKTRPNVVSECLVL